MLFYEMYTILVWGDVLTVLFWEGYFELVILKCKLTYYFKRYFEWSTTVLLF